MARTGLDQSGPSFVGREPVLETVLATIGAAGATGVELIGPAGVGKTRTASVCADALTAAQGRRALWVSANPVLSDIPLGALAPTLSALGVGSYAAADVVPSLVDALSGTRGDARPTLLVVDDVQFLDPDSDQLLAELATLDTVAVLATRRWDDGNAEGKLTAPLVGVEMAPFSRAETELMLRGMLGGALDPELVDAAWERSQGLPLFLEAFVEAALRDGAVRDEGMGWQFVPERFDARATTVKLMVDGALRGDAAARRAAQLLAMADPMRATQLVALAGLETVSALEAAGIAVHTRAEGRDEYQVRHPLFGEVLRAEIGSLERRVLLRELIETAPDLSEGDPLDKAKVARWRLDAGLVDPADALDLAEAATAVGDLLLAERLARIAFEEAPSPGATALLARVLHTQSRYDEADPLWERAIDEAPDDLARVTLMSIRVFRPFATPAEALAHAERMAVEVTDPQWQVFSTVYPGWVLVVLGQPRAGLQLCADLWRDRERLSRVDRDELTSFVLGARLLAGDIARCEEAYLEVSPDRDGPPPSGWFDRALVDRAFWAACLGFQGRFDEALAVVDAEYPTGAPAVRTWCAIAAGQVHQVTGRFDDAVAWYSRCLLEPFVPSRPARPAAAALIESAMLSGAVRAERLGRQVLGRDPSREHDLSAGRIARAQALAMGAAGRSAGDRSAHLRAAHARLRPLESWALESEVLVEVALLGTVTDDELTRFTGIAAEMASPLPDARLAVARAVHGGSVDELVRAAEGLEALGARWEAARALELASLTSGAQRAEGATWADRARSIAADCGVVPAFQPMPGSFVRLRQRERQAVRVLLAGATTGEMGAALGVANSTAAHLVERIYMRLGVSSRAELVATLPAEGGAAGPEPLVHAVEAEPVPGGPVAEA